MGEHDRIAAAIGELETARTLLRAIISTPVPAQACTDEGGRRDAEGPVRGTDHRPALR
ncbi:hypothetical protein HDA32_002774 [Spinactinospora alkalitolerans]|uniref:Uncharacterized protein n=1 Tax=Spinactinospora alkalitolerans TaxID=687207 RepID=A0A852U0C4_9ACTN|nr:hypothetical protein [Spinactinospora alkalitolerans]NYE47654.1 hypothetical protein [Spinactinospora alkalitolerans]